MAASAAGPDSRGWFAAPAPIRELFKLFPLRVYAQEPLPARAAADAATTSSSRQRPTLYVFSTDEDARRGKPSFNPSCLKWQTYLKIAGIDFDIVSSNNHASPSGALPFLLPPQLPTRAALPLTGEKIGRYAREYVSKRVQDVSTPRLEAYEALLTQNVRPAWLYALYLQPDNDALLSKLYLPSSIFLREPLRHTLHAAATSEILKTTRRALLVPSQLLADADAAFSALSTLLDTNDWFFGAEGPGLLDTEVFAYTHLLLDESLGWRDNALARCLAKYPNLVQHRGRLLKLCWS